MALLTRSKGGSISNSKLLLCHFSALELQSLDELQGGMSIDPDTGLREYSSLAKALDKPEVKMYLAEHYQKMLAAGKKGEKDIALVAQETLPPFKPSPGDEESTTHAIERLGRGKDKFLALAPANLVHFLIELNAGKYSLNPKTGLLEFFFGALAAGLASAAIGGFFASKARHQSQGQAEAAAQAAAAEQRRRIEEERIASGYYLPWNPDTQPRQWIRNPNWTRTGTEPYFLDEPQPYKTGGTVRESPLRSFIKSSGIYGKGNGQDDAIKTTIPTGSYIIDATTTAHLGDGSSSAGIKALEKAAQQIRSRYPKQVVKEVEQSVEGQHQQTPVYVANEEFKFDPVTVALAGDGSIQKGSRMFKQMVHNIRKHKASNGLGLPPRAKSPLEYLSA